MGRGLLDSGSPGQALAAEASELIGMDLVRLACEAADEEIVATEVAQPLILVHSLALLELLPAGARAAAAVAGHSLGEYTGLVASGALDWREALLLVRRRGLAMAAAAGGEPQGMSAVLGLDGAVVEAVLEEVAGAGTGGGPAGSVVVAANLNAPGQVVISGHLAALEAAAEPLRRAGARRVMPLSVGGAFHSPLMAAAAAELAEAIDAAPLRPAALPQAFDVDGAIRTQPGEVRDALRRQLTSAVRWVDCVQTLAGLGCDRFVEVGPGAALAAMGRRILPEASWASVATPEAARGLAAVVA
jgi:[acyl-carrier-protein] S-malonyltransferase